MKIGDLVKDVVFNVGGIGIILKTNHHLYEVQFSDGAKRWLVGERFTSGQKMSLTISTNQLYYIGKQQQEVSDGLHQTKNECVLRQWWQGNNGSHRQDCISQVHDQTIQRSKDR